MVRFERGAEVLSFSHSPIVALLRLPQIAQQQA
jgi:hypothetical protein